MLGWFFSFFLFFLSAVENLENSGRTGEELSSFWNLCECKARDTDSYQQRRWGGRSVSKTFPPNYHQPLFLAPSDKRFLLQLEQHWKSHLWYHFLSPTPAIHLWVLFWKTLGMMTEYEFGSSSFQHFSWGEASHLRVLKTALKSRWLSWEIILEWGGRGGSRVPATMLSGDKDVLVALSSSLLTAGSVFLLRRWRKPPGN